MPCGRWRNNGAAALLAAIAFLQPWGAVVADLPVHCLRHQIAGEWEFTLGPLGPKRSSCGHSHPDNPESQPDADSFLAVPSVQKRRLTLKDPDTVLDSDGTEGRWTMIYDEGFEVTSGDYVYFAFSKFEYVLDGTGSKTNVSHCEETQLGWYRNKARTAWGCYAGRKVPAGMPLPPNLAGHKGFLVKPPAKSAGAKSETAGAAPHSPAAGKSLSDRQTLQLLEEMPTEYTPWVPSSPGYDKPMQEDWQRSLADALNFLQLGWTATAYEDKFAGKTPRQLNRLAGVRRPMRPQHSSKHDTPAVKSRGILALLGLRSRVRRHKMSLTATEAFDWRKQDGKNWLTPVVSQGDCGSCYTIATMHMLTARNRIQQNDPAEPEFSVSFPLYCSEYNQGCDGGYGFLQSKWNEDVGLVPESCLPFSTGGGSCKVAKSCQLGAKRYRASNHRYVGGYYGGSDESHIKKELVTNGPMVLSFEPKEDFMYYKAGVYSSALQKIHQEWEQVDHAVLLVAYGVDKNKPYWTLQNSWGEDWGEAGFFRMARGSDESGIESIAAAADVMVEKQNPVLEEFIAGL
eukprot:TRINITY_DN5514_c0_g2_i1.p1 TRINITY_DN5514_c0_g2~~TRINITY_DN5514_c0_g2_i1.p1  ORF type:complete len:570 (+),score=92.28 TRINITY_DN5514_c0_g2_i1:85-1794(+)